MLRLIGIYRLGELTSYVKIISNIDSLSFYSSSGHLSADNWDVGGFSFKFFDDECNDILTVCESKIVDVYRFFDDYIFNDDLYGSFLDYHYEAYGCFVVSEGLQSLMSLFANPTPDFNCCLLDILYGIQKPNKFEFCDKSLLISLSDEFKVKLRCDEKEFRRRFLKLKLLSSESYGLIDCIP